MQSPFAGKVAPHIIGQRRHQTGRGRDDKADAPIRAHEQNGKDGKQAAHAGENDDAKQR